MAGPLPGACEGAPCAGCQLTDCEAVLVQVFRSTDCFLWEKKHLTSNGLLQNNFKKKDSKKPFNQLFSSIYDVPSREQRACRGRGGARGRCLEFYDALKAN